MDSSKFPSVNFLNNCCFDFFVASSLFCMSSGLYDARTDKILASFLNSIGMSSLTTSEALPRYFTICCFDVLFFESHMLLTK